MFWFTRGESHCLSPLLVTNRCSLRNRSANLDAIGLPGGVSRLLATEVDYDLDATGLPGGVPRSLATEIDYDLDATGLPGGVSRSLATEIDYGCSPSLIQLSIYVRI